jgi:hypothetical protein
VAPNHEHVTAANPGTKSAPALVDWQEVTSGNPIPRLSRSCAFP